MNEQPARKTFFGACPHDCPDTCAMIYEVEDGRLVEVRGNKEHPMTRGGLCVKLKDFHDHHANPDRLLYPLRRIGPKGSRQFARIILGRGDRRNRQALARDHRDLWQPGDHALFLSRQYGLGAGHQFRRSVLQPSRLDGEREDLLRVGLFDRLAAHCRPDRRRRSGELRAFEIHRDLGLQLDLDQSAPLAVRARSAEARRQGRGDRYLPLAHGQGCRLAHLPASREPTALWRWVSSTRS